MSFSGIEAEIFGAVRRGNQLHGVSGTFEMCFVHLEVIMERQSVGMRNVGV